MSVESELKGQTFLVTGGAKRLGKSICLALAQQGANVVVHYKSSESEAGELLDELRALGVSTWKIAGDLQLVDKTESLFEEILGMCGPIQGLINCASIFPNDRVEDLTPEMLNVNINVNALSPFFLARAFAKQDIEGSVLNLLDTRIHDYDAEHVSYHLSKRMLFSMTRMMAIEFAPKVRVNAIAPGLILPPAGEDESYLEKLASSNPLNKYGSPKDIVEAALYLLKSTFVTGQVLYVDGGRHMTGGLYG